MKIISTISLSLISLFCFSQVQKKVIVEHFTNTVCSVCAVKNPELYSNLNNYPHVMHIAYHPSSPYSSCLLNQHNVSENDARTNYYGIYGATPRLVIQGEVTSPNVSFSGAETFTAYFNQESEVSMQLNQTKFGLDSIQVNLIIKTEVSHNYTTENLLVGLAEDTIFYSSPNGEDEHYDVFRKAFSSINGDAVTIPGNVGDSVVLTWMVNSHLEWDLSRIFAYAILQTDTKELIQAEYLLADGSASPMDLNSSVGVSSEEKVLGVTIFPNPAVNNVTINTYSDEMSSIIFYNLIGEKVITTSVKGMIQVDVSSFPKGIYLVEVKNKKETLVKKLYIK